ncbi:MAG: indole-3-glycerol phosphate synthase TrpC [Candidatus Eisenbacteria bacterium]
MFLDEIFRWKREEVAARKGRRSFASVRREAEERADVRPFREALRRGRISLIAEIKKASPSAGVLREELAAGGIAAAYEENGASAVSVVTDERFFLGSLSLLREARGAVRLPVLCKDFVIDPYQIAEASAAGADAFLLIAGSLGRSRASDLLAFGREIGLEGLVEVHRGEDLDEALAAGAETIGVNNRDLRTFGVDIRTSLDLAGAIPREIVRVSESGIRVPEEVRLLREAGFDAVLVGESLMRAESPGEEVRRLIGGER